MHELLALIVAEPLSWPVWAVLTFAAGMYPVGLMFNTPCSKCCCKCSKCNHYANRYNFDKPGSNCQAITGNTATITEYGTITPPPFSTKRPTDYDETFCQYGYDGDEDALWLDGPFFETECPLTPDCASYPDPESLPVIVQRLFWRWYLDPQTTEENSCGTANACTKYVVKSDVLVTLAWIDDVCDYIIPFAPVGDDSMHDCNGGTIEFELDAPNIFRPNDGLCTSNLSCLDLEPILEKIRDWTGSATITYGTCTCGACCDKEGRCEDDVVEGACRDGSDDPADHKPGTPCVADPLSGETLCPQPGACCETDYTCSTKLEDDCTGDWLGPGVWCGDSPCPPPPPQMGTCCNFAHYTCFQELDTICNSNPDQAWFGVDVPCEACGFPL